MNSNELTFGLTFTFGISYILSIETFFLELSEKLKNYYYYYYYYYYFYCSLSWKYTILFFADRNYKRKRK